MKVEIVDVNECPQCSHKGIGEIIETDKGHCCLLCGKSLTSRYMIKEPIPKDKTLLEKFKERTNDSWFASQLAEIAREHFVGIAKDCYQRAERNCACCGEIINALKKDGKE